MQKYEINPLCVTGKDARGEDIVERCGAEEAQFYGVYRINERGFHDWVSDHATIAEAEIAIAQLHELYLEVFFEVAYMIGELMTLTDPVIGKYYDAQGTDGLREEARHITTKFIEKYGGDEFDMDEFIDIIREFAMNEFKNLTD